MLLTYRLNNTGSPFSTPEYIQFFRGYLMPYVVCNLLSVYHTDTITIRDG